MNALVIPLSYLASLIAVLIVHGMLGFSMNEWGTPLSQTVMQMAGGAVIAFFVGIIQKTILNRIFNVPASWIYTLMVGFVLAELIAGIILWQMGLNRGELRFIEGRPLPEAVIFTCSGFMVGLLQWTVLRQRYPWSVLWIPASSAGWGICVVMTFVLSSVWAFFIGSLLYGAITGATLAFIFQQEEIRPEER